MKAQSPRSEAERTTRQARIPTGIGDRVAGYGVMGVPFANGEYLALRHWTASSFGPGYRSVWHRDRVGDWTIYADAPPELSCARFVGAAAQHTKTTEITIDWHDDHRLSVLVAPHITWTMELAETSATRLLSAAGSAMSNRIWGMHWLLRAMGAGIGPMLGSGRMQLTGQMPNGHDYRLAPRRVWVVERSTAHIEGRDLGAQQALRSQARLGGLWLPQRGLFYAHTSGQFQLPHVAPHQDGEVSPTRSVHPARRPLRAVSH